MALDANIILQAAKGGRNLADAGTSFLQGYNTVKQGKALDLQNKLTEEQIAQQKFKSLDDREKSRISSTVYGAAELQPYLESGNIEGAKSFLERRKVNLQKRAAAGENVDTVETDEALVLLEQDPEKLKQTTSQLIGFGQKIGTLKTNKELTQDIPSGVREYNYYEKLPPEKKKEYLAVKRNMLGEGQFLDESGEAMPISGYNPNREATKQAEARGTETGKTEGEKTMNIPKAQSSLKTATANFDNTLSKIDKVLPQVNDLTSGFVGTQLSKIPGTKATDLKKTIDTIQANLGFQELQTMRDNSPTGGALGNVTERELELLTAAKENLSNSQTPEQLRDNLANLKTQIAASKTRIREAYETDFGRFDQQGGQKSQLIPLNQALQNKQMSQPGQSLEIDFNDLQ